MVVMVVARWVLDTKAPLVLTRFSLSGAMVSPQLHVLRCCFKLTIDIVTPILGAIIADQYLGKYKTIVIFAAVYIVGLIILFATSIPGALQHGSGTGGFITAILIIGLGTGGVSLS